VRLRLLLPRSRRRRGLGGLALAAASALLAAGCGGSDEPRTVTAATLPPLTLPTPTPKKPAAPPAPRLGIGLTEFNANLLNHGDTPPAFAPWRDRVEALRPRWFRLVVQWDTAAPKPTAAPAFDHPEDGCVRGIPPCAPFSGVRGLLRAVASQQRAHPGQWNLMVVLTYAPAWAATGPRGCEPEDTQARSRPVDTEALPGYRNLIRSLLAEAKADGAKVGALSPWNEPNHPSFISPQRATCDAHARLLSPAVYAKLAGAAHDELKGTDVKLVLGELAGKVAPSPLAGGVDEFVRALPNDVACAGAIWGQHMYTDLPYDPDFAGPVGQLERALDARPCTKGKPIWITESGVGAAHPGRTRSADPAQLLEGCRAQAAALRRWSRDERIQNVFQYEFRDAPDFPVGLADAGLTRPYPVYGMYRRASRGKYSC
jgi:hypothetical protein